MVELEADLSADLLPLPRGDLVHHVHQNRVEDRQAQRLRNTQRIAYFINADDINMYVGANGSVYVWAFRERDLTL